MDENLHKEQHEKLHKALDELAADMIMQTNMLPSTTTVLQLMQWSFQQTKNPTENL